MIITGATSRPEFARKCWETQKAYADRIGVEFHKTYFSSLRPNLEKFSMMLKAPTDRVLWFDWDVMVAPNAENLFERKSQLVCFRGERMFNGGLILANKSIIQSMGGVVSRQANSSASPFKADPLIHAWLESSKIETEFIAQRGDFTHLMNNKHENTN